MIHSVCGLNADQVGLVVHSLSHSDDKDLATLFITSLALIDTTLLLLLKEMFSTRKHILYWTQLAKSPSWEIYLYRLNSVVFKSVFVNKERDYLILNSSELMLRHAEMLRSDLSDLSILLEKVSAAAAHLKAVYVQLNSVGGTMSNARRKLGLIKPGLQSESDFKVPEGGSLDDIGVKLGLSMVSVEEEETSQNIPNAKNIPSQFSPSQPHKAVFGLSVPSEDDEWEIKDSAVDVLEQQQHMRFEHSHNTHSAYTTHHNTTETEQGIQELSLIRLSVRRELEQCLVGLAESFAEYLPHLVLALPLAPPPPLTVFSPESNYTTNINTTSNNTTTSNTTTNPSNSTTTTHSPGLKLNPSNKHSDLTLQELEDLYDRLETFLDTLRTTRGTKAFPLQFTQARVHKPSDRERYWFRNLLIGIVGVYTLQTAVSLWRDGSVLSAYHFAQGKVQDHIIEPMTKLGRELFDTIRSRDEVVTREECDESRESLHRMLRDFSQTDHGSSLISDMKEKIGNTIKEQKQVAVNVASKITRGSGGNSGSSVDGGAGGISGGDSSASVVDVVGGESSGGGGGRSGSNGGKGGGGVGRGSSGGSISSGGGVGDSSINTSGITSGMNTTTSDITHPTEFTPEQAMSALMSAYEKELQAPVKGIMFGNLMTAILIQMQKLKVHTEAAMLKMDQILASNELTIAATAAMPAFGFIGLMLLQLRKWAQPRASSPGLATLHLRLIMSDVERSLQEVHELNSSISGSGNSSSGGGRSGKLNAAAGLYYDVAGGTHTTHNVHTTHATHTNTSSANTNTNTNNTISPTGIDNKLHRYHTSLHTRRVQIARGTLQFNLVRLRSEFQNLFGGSKGTVASVNDSVSQARGLSLTRGANRGLGLGLSSGSTLGMSMGIGVNIGFSSPRPSFSVASTMRQYRLRRSSSAATASTLFASNVTDGGGVGNGTSGVTSITNTNTSSNTANTTSPPITTTTVSNTTTTTDEEAKMELVHQMLTFMQTDESQESNNILSTVYSVLSRLYTMVAGSGEELTATTQYGSLSRDIALLESPDFEVSLDRKICTAARMRATYSCLMPSLK